MKRSGRVRAYRPFLEPLEERLAPATNAWIGAGLTTRWSESANWSLNRAPASGDDLEFGAQGAIGTRATINDILSTTTVPAYNSITISDTGYSMAPSGAAATNAIALVGPINVGTGLGIETISLNVQMAPTVASSQQTITVGFGSTLIMSGRLSSISALQTLTKAGTGTIEYQGDNSGFTGAFTIANSGGVAVITHNLALGTGAVIAGAPNAGITTVNPNSQLQVRSVTGSIPARLRLNAQGIANDGAILNVAGNNTWLGAVSIDTDSTLGANANTSLNFAGLISDAASGRNITKVGTGEVIFSRVGGNTYRGMTTINNGILTIQDPLSLGAGANALSPLNGTPQASTLVNFNSVTGEAGTLQLRFVTLAANDPNGILQNPALPFNAITNPYVGFQVFGDLITLNGPGFNALGALSNVAGNNTWNGSVVLGSPAPSTGTISIGAATNTNLAIQGVVSDPNRVGSLVKVLGGRLILDNNNSFDGVTVVATGFLNIRDSRALGNSPSVTVVNGASLELSVDAGLDGTALRTRNRNLGFDSTTGTGPAQEVFVTGVTGTFRLTFNGQTTTPLPVGSDAATVQAALTALSSIGAGNATVTKTGGLYRITFAGALLGVNVPLMTAQGFDGAGTTVSPVYGLQVAYPLTINGSGAGNTGALRSVSGLNVYTGAITLDNQGTTTDAIGVDPDTRPGHFLGDSNYFTNDYSLTVTGNINELDVTNPLVTQQSVTLAKVGTGHLILPSANSYTGPTNIQQGWVTVRNNQALGSQIATLPQTRQVFTTVAAGAALHLKPITAGGTLNLPYNFVLSGRGITHNYNLIHQAGALENLDGNSTLRGLFQFNGVASVGVEQVPTTSTSTTVPALIHSYELNGSFADALGGPDLVPNPYGTPGTLNATNYSFGAGQGLTLSGALPNPANYSIEMTFNIAQITSWRNLIEFANRQSDAGLYNKDSRLQFYLDSLTTVDGPTGAFSPNTDITLLFTRDGTTKEVVGYLNGIEQIRFFDTANKAVFSGPNAIMHFFIDDLIIPNEESAGVVDRIRIYDGPITPPQPTSSSQLTLTGQLFDFGTTNGGLTKLGTQRLIIQGPGTYTGPVEVAAGAMLVQNDTALGVGNNTTTTVQFGASLELGNTLTNQNGGLISGVEIWNERLILNGTGNPSFGDGALTVLSNNSGAVAPVNNPLVPTDNAWHGPITLNTHSNILVGADSRLVVSGAITDTSNSSVEGSNLTIAGAGEVWIEGTNTYRGSTFLNSGILTIGDSRALGDAGSPEVQSINLVGATTATQFRLTFNGQTTAPITYTGDGPTDAANIQTALAALSTISGVAGTVAVTQLSGPPVVPDMFRVSFGGSLNGFAQPLMTVTNLAGPFTVPAPTRILAGRGGTTIANGASLQLAGSITVAGEPLLVNGQGAASTPNVTPQWFAIGPSPIANGTTPGSGITTGRVTSVVSDPRDSNIIYIGTAGGGAWKTIDGGRSWRPIFDAVPEIQTITVGGGAPATFTLTFGGVTTVAITSASPTLAADIQAALSALTTIGGVGGRVIVTQSGTNVFRVTFDGTLIGTDVAPITTSSGAVTVATTQNGLDPKLALYIGAIAIDPVNRDIIYLGTGETNNSPDSFYGTGIYRSNDGGITWSLHTGIETQILTVQGTSGTFTLTYDGQTTTNLNFNASGADVQNALNVLTNINAAGNVVVTRSTTQIREVQTFTVTATTGNVTLTFNGATATFPFNETAVNVQTALNALGTITAVGGVTVALTGTVYTITFNQPGDQLAFVPTGGTVAELTRGAFLYEISFTNPPVGLDPSQIVPNVVGATPTAGVVTRDPQNPFDGKGISKIVIDPVTNVMYVASGDGGVGRNEIQDVRPRNSPTNTGTFTLTFTGPDATGTIVSLTTAAITFDNNGPNNGANRLTTAANIDAALEALSNIGGVGGNVTVVPTGGGGGPFGTPFRYRVTFGGALSQQNLVQLTGSPPPPPGNPSVEISTFVDGGNGRVVNGTTGGAGIWRLQNRASVGGLAWYNLTSVVSTNRATVPTTQAVRPADGANPLAGATDTTNPPRTPGPDDDYRLQFPQTNATWSDVALIYTDTNNTVAPNVGPARPVLYAALGIAGGSMHNNVYWTQTSTSDAPIWYVGDPTGSPFSSPAVPPPAGPPPTVDSRSGGFPRGTFRAWVANNGAYNMAADIPLNGNIKIGAAAGTYFNSSTVYAAVAGPTGTLREIYRTTNGGQSWAATPQPSAPNSYLFSLGAFSNSILVVDANNVFIGGHGINAAGALPIYQTPNGGTNWVNLSPGGDGTGPQSGFHALHRDANGRLLAASDGGIWRLETTGNWTNLNSNLAISQINGIAQHPTQTESALAGAQANGVSVYSNNQTWNRVDGYGGGQVAIDPLNPSTLYAVTLQVVGNPIVRKSTNGGTTWNTILSPAGTSVPLVLDRINSARLLVGGTILQESINGGNSFRNLAAPVVVTEIALATYQGLFQTDLSFPLVTDRGTNTYDPDTIYITNGTIVYVSKNRGQTWSDRTTGTDLADLGSIVDLEVDPRNRGTAYAVRSAFGGSQVFVTNDSGGTWVDITGNLPNVPAWKIVVDPRTGYLYVGNDDGVYQSTDEGITWNRFGVNMPHTQVKFLELNQTTNTIIAGTYGRSAFQLYLGSRDTATTPVRAALVALSGQSVWNGPVIIAGDPTQNTVSFGAYGTQDISNGISAAQLNIVGVISDLLPSPAAGARIAKVGLGDIIFSGANVYRGATEVREGGLVVDNNQALGLNSVGTTVFQTTAVNAQGLPVGAVLKLRTNLNAEPITLNGDGIPFDGHYTGALRNVSGFNTYTGPLTLSTLDAISGATVTRVTIGADSGSQLTMTGVISGGAAGYRVFKEGTGIVSFAGDNTFNALVQVNQGALRVEHNNALNPTLGANVLDGAQVQIQSPAAGPSVTSIAPLLLSGTGIFGTGALLNTGGNNRWNGNITMTTLPGFSPLSAPGGVVAMGSTNPGETLTIGGVIAQGTTSLGLSKVGQGIVALESDNNYTGFTHVLEGTLDVKNAAALGDRAASLVSVQRIVTLSPEATGSFTVGFNGQQTAAQTFAVAQATLQTAINALLTAAGFAGTTVTVVGTTIPTFTATGNGPANTGFVYTITFAGPQAQTLVPLTAFGSNGTTAVASTVADGGRDVLVDFGATLNLNNTTVTARQINLNGPGVGNLGALHSSGGNNAWAGRVILESTSSIGASAGTALTLSGGVDGGSTADLEKVDAGTLIFPVLTLPAANTYLGRTIVTTGTAQVNGTIGPVVLNGGTLAGTGTVGNVSSNLLTSGQSTIGPGNSIGTLTVQGTPATEQQQIILNGGAIGSSFNLTLVGPTGTATTANIPYGAAGEYPLASDVASAINAILASVGYTGASVSVTGFANLYFVSFDGGSLAGRNVRQMTANSTPDVIVDISTLTDGPGMTLSASDRVFVELSRSGGGVLTNDRINVSGDVLLAGQIDGDIVPTSSTIQVNDEFTIIQTSSGGRVEGRFDGPQANRTLDGIDPLAIDATIAYIDGVKFNVVYFTDRVVLKRNLPNLSITLSPSVASPVYGEREVITATITPEPLAPALSGSILFTLAGPDNTSTTVTVVDPTTTYTFDIAAVLGSAPRLGTYTVTADYDGDPTFRDTTATLSNLIVSPAPSRTTLASSVTPSSVFGQSVTFTATVDTALTSPVVGTLAPGGTVFFFDGATQIGTGTLSTVSGTTAQATFATSALAVAGHFITAVYQSNGSPDNYNTSSSLPLLQTVLKADTTTSVTAAPTPSTFGQSVRLTAIVSANAPGAGNPGGNVTFRRGTGASATVLGNGMLSMVAGQMVATFDTTAFQLLAGANQTITATYNGDTSFLPSVGQTTHTVNQAATTTTVVGAPSTSTFGSAVTFTATITPSPSGNAPTGSVTFSVGATTLGSAAVSTIAGVTRAVFTTTNFQLLAGAGQTITATYNGDSNYLSSSGTTTQTVNKADTSVAVAASPGTSAFGQQVTFTATVTPAPAGGTPTGTVTFMIGATPLGTGTLSTSSGITTATYTTTAFQLNVGTATVTAVYSGDDNYNGNTGATTQTVDKATTSTTVVSAANPSAFGQTVTFTATVAAVSPGSGNPTGTVTFRIGTTTLGTGMLSTSSGITTATITTTAFQLTVGAGQTVTATYDGDGNYNMSSGTVSQTVNKAGTTTLLTSGSNPSVVGQPVTFTATVSANAPGSGNPTGVVTFSLGGTTLGTGVLSTVAGITRTTFTTSASQLLLGANQTITATYAGDSNYNTSLGTVQQTVNQAGTTTSVVAAPSTIAFGETVTYTATVAASAPGSGTPTGTVTFRIGATTLGTGTLATSGGVTTASFTTAAYQLPVGTGQTVTATYSGDTNFQTSAGTTTQNVTKGSTTTTVLGNPNISVFGQSVTFTATVRPTIPNGAVTGSVTFSVGATVLGTMPLALSGGVMRASITTTTELPVGTSTITATYNSDSNFNSSTGTTSQSVGKSVTGTTVTTSLSPSVFGDQVTFTATVAPSNPGSGNPTGTVTFSLAGTTLGTGTLSTVAGVTRATFTTSAFQLQGGPNQTINAVYEGDGNFFASSGTTLQTVNRAGTTTSVVSSLNPSNFGQTVTFTATVTPPVTPAPVGGAPTGSVTFEANGVVLGTVNVTTTSGITTASFTTSAFQLPAGVNLSITATYSGSTNFAPSAGSTLQTVKGQTTTALTVATLFPGRLVFVGEPINLTATVTPAITGSFPGTPSGSVTFRDGATVLGTIMVDGTGRATLQTALGTPTGPRNLTATYNGDAAYMASPAATSSVTVNALGTQTSTVTLTTTGTPSKVGNPVTLTARITATGTPTGFVTFKEGATVLGQVALGSNLSASITLTSLSVGVHPITAEYSGDQRFARRTSAVLNQEVIVPRPNTTTVTSSLATSVFGQAVTLTAVVRDNGAAPAKTATGQIAFFADGVFLGLANLTTVSAGVARATLTIPRTTPSAIPALPVGIHNITAYYGGDLQFDPSTSAEFQQTVNAAGTTTGLVSSVTAPRFGQPVTYTATVRPVAPGAGPVTGTVTFFDGTNEMGTTDVVQSGTTFVARFTTSSLALGTHVIRAVYNLDGSSTNHRTSTSGNVSQTVSKAATTATVTSSSTTNNVPVVLTARIAAVAPATGVPTGNVQFKVNGVLRGTVGLDGNGQAQLNLGLLATGTYTVQIIYGGDLNYLGSNRTLTLTITVGRGT